MKANTKEVNREYSISEEQAKNIFDNLTLGFALCELILDQQGNPIDYRFLKINPAFEKQTAMNASSVIGKTIKEIYPDIEHSWIEKYASVVINSKPISFIDFNHNTNRFYNVNGISVYENMFAMYFEDITEKKKSEAALKKSDKQYKELFNSMDEIFQVIELIYDKDSKVVDFYYLELNSALEKMVNKKKEELIGKTAKEIFGNVEDYWLETFDRIEKTGIRENYENYAKELNKYYNINAWKIDKGKIAVISTDITERKNIEKERLENHRLNTIGEMAASIAHDFNNSLQSILGNLEIVKLQKGLSDTTLDRLNSINTTITDVSSRVQALQHFGDKDHESKESELIDFNSMFEESIKQSRPLWKDGVEKNGFKINLTTDYGDIPNINCNKGELKSAIYNLTKNSIEAMPEGGTITIKTGTKTEGVFATFTDTGIGMDYETKLKIFQPFYTTKGFELGRGLGMSGVYHLIKKHGGDIRVKFSELGKGTTIEIVFPINHQNDMKEVIEKEITTAEFYNVLWVDDDLTIRETSSELLELMDHKCDTADGGKNALQLLDKNKYDIVFTDIGMPEMNGWELIDAIRNKFGDKIKIVVVTGWDIDKEENKKGNYNYSLQKPFTMGELEKVFMSI
jgi:signal transduction histidine kinase